MDGFDEACEVMKRQLGHDVVISLATCVSDMPSVRTVNGYYRDGSIYVVTHMSTHKMREIAENNNVAICRDLFSAHGTGRSIGNPRDAVNKAVADELRRIFVAFYNRHVDETDPQTCILRVDLRDAVVFDEHSKYTVDFRARTARIIPFKNDIVH